jgi:hypothetical protein
MVLWQKFLIPLFHRYIALREESCTRNAATGELILVFHSQPFMNFRINLLINCVNIIINLIMYYILEGVKYAGKELFFYLGIGY